MGMQDVFEKTYKFVDDFKDTNEYKELMNLKEKINEQLKEKVKRFNDLKEKYEECLKYDKYHPDLKRIQKELSEAKTSLFSEELVIKYKELEKTLEENLNTLLTNICQKVSNKIKNNNIINDLRKYANK